VASLALPACTLFSSSLQPDPEYQLSSSELALAQIKRWSVGARLSVRYDNKAWSGGLRWRQSPESFVLAINAPLGQGALRLKGDADAVHFESADGRQIQAEDLPEMIRHELGFDLPVVEMRNWIRGLPASPGGAFIRRDQAQRIVSIRQRGWQIDYSHYQAFSGHWLARKIKISDGSYDIRVALYEWNDESEAPAPSETP